MRRWILLIIAFGLLLAFFFNFYHFLKARVTRTEFKVLTEQKIGQVLNANVKIGRIRFGLLKHVALSGLEIDQSDSKLPVQIGVRRIVIKYDLLAFIKQKFRVPTEVLLDNPTLNFKSFISPFSLAGLNFMDMKGSVFKRIELESGEMDVPVPFVQDKVHIEKVKGKANLDEEGVLHLNFTGEASKVLQGSFAVSGLMNPETKSGKLHFDLTDAKFLDPRIPVEGINGSFDLSENEMVISKLVFKMRGVPVSISGTISRPFDPKPAWDLVVEVEEGRKKIVSNSKVDFEAETLSGNLQLFGKAYDFSGGIAANENGYQFKDVLFSNNFKANGGIDFKNGFYAIQAERRLQRFETKVNLSDLEVVFDLNFYHFKYFGYDVTTSAKVKMAPVEPAWSQGDRRFGVHMTTNYFIFNYHPLKDFRADFTISENGIDPFTAAWGNITQLKGAFSFGLTPGLDFTILINEYDLKELPALGVHLMPISLEGKLQGKIKLVGPVNEPDITGYLAIGQGKIGDFRFDHADLSFFGKAPRLKLLDSKIVRKDNTFAIGGVIDLTLENIFQKVTIESKDQIIIWKGLDVSMDIQRRKEVMQPGTNVKTQLPPGVGPSGNPGGGKIQAEYAVGPGSVSVSAEESEDKERVVTIGPKLRF